MREMKQTLNAQRSTLNTERRIQNGLWVGRWALDVGRWTFSACTAMTPTLQIFLIVSAALFSIGLLAALSRRHAIFILIGIELMLAAANLNFIAFWRFAPQPHQPTGVMFAIFSIAISAAEAAVGLAMVIAVYRHYHTTNVDQLNQLKG